MATTEFDWAELAFSSKKALRALDATFIAAPRQLSVKRFKQLLQQYLPSRNIVLGIAAEAYVAGFENQPQFEMLEQSAIQAVVDLIHAKSSAHKVYILRYSQKDLVHVLDKVSFANVIMVNGSWQRSFHTLPAYNILASQKIAVTLVSPFVDEAEARKTSNTLMKPVVDATPLPEGGSIVSLPVMMSVAETVARRSFDYGFQTGAALGRRLAGPEQRYEFLTAAYNKVVPYQTFAMHNGASREKHFAQTNDLNYYDTVHAEVELLITVAKEGIDLSGTTLCINLLPCPTCSRMLADTAIAEIVYQQDHSAGYAVAMLEAAGKTVRRTVAGVL